MEIRELLYKMEGEVEGEHDLADSDQEVVFVSALGRFRPVGVSSDGKVCTIHIEIIG